LFLVDLLASPDGRYRERAMTGLGRLQAFENADLRA
jgi:hypothetical protein